MRATVDFPDAQLLSVQFEQRDTHQIFGRFREQAEAVDHFDLQVLEGLFVSGVGNALVENQARVHIRQVGFGDQCRHAQVDFRSAAQRLIEIGLLALANRLHRALKHFHVQGEAHRLDLAALAVPEQFACATDFQVVGGEHEARAQVLGVGNRFQTLFGVVGDLFAWRGQQVGIGLVVTAPDAPAQLVQLGQAELVGALDDDGVGARYVDAGLDDGRGDQHIEALVVEVAHHLFEFALAHLPVADADTRLRHQLGQVGGAFLDGLDVVVQVIDLTAAQQLAQQGFLDGRLVLLHHEGAHRQPARRWRRDDRQIAHARDGHVQGARDRRCGQGQNIDLAAQRLELFLLAHAKPVFFVDDHQAEVLDLDVILQKLVRTDDDVDLALCQIGNCGVDFLGRLEAAHHFDGHRPVGETVAEAVVVLLGEQGGRHQNGHLTPAMHGDEGCAHGHFGLAEAHVATDQAIHRLGRQHVGAHGVDGGLLIRCLFERKACAEGRVIGFRVGKCIAFAGCATRVDIQQFGCHVTDLLGSLALGFLPGFRAQAMQRRRFVVAAGVTGNQVQVGDRDVQLGVFGVGQHQKFGNLVFDFQRREPEITTYAMVDVHHRRAFAQFGEVLDDCVVVAAISALFAATALHDALAEQRAFCDQRQGRLFQQQAFVKRRDGDRQPVLAVDEVQPAVDGFGAQLETFEQFQQHFPASGGLGGEQHAPREVIQKLRQGRQWLSGLGFDGQVRQGLRGKTLASGTGVDILLAGDHTRPVFQACEAVFHR